MLLDSHIYFCPACLVGRREHISSWPLCMRGHHPLLLCLWPSLSRHLLPFCLFAHLPAGPRNPSISLALECLSVAKAQTLLLTTWEDSSPQGGLLSTGSPSQMCLGCRAQATGQEGPEMLQILSFLHSTGEEAAQRGHFIVRAALPCAVVGWQLRGKLGC